MKRKTPEIFSRSATSEVAAAVSIDISKGTKKNKKQPLLHIVKRNASSASYNLFVRLCAIGFALLIILLFFNGVTGYSFNYVWELLFEGAFGTEFSVNMWLNSAAMLLMVSVALAPVFKMKFWNIGAQGQILMGALLAAVVMRYFAEEMTYSGSIFIMLLFGFLAGGIWALIPAFCKAKFGANETLFTLMMNYIAIQLVGCTVRIWQGKNTSLGFINADSHAGYLADMFDNPYGAIIFIAAIFVVFTAVYLNHTKQGFELTVVGDSPNTAKYAGMNTAKIIMRTVFLSGAICGIVGMLYVSGVEHTLTSTISGSYGFTAIIVAWTAKFNPVVMVIVSMAIAFFERGAIGVNDTTTTLNSYTSYIIIGIFLFFIIGCEFFVNYKIVYNEKIVTAYTKFRDRLESKVPWLVHACAFCAATLHKCSEKTEGFFAAAETKIKLGVSKAVRIVFDKTTATIVNILSRIKMLFGKKHTEEFSMPDDDASRQTSATDEEVHND